VLGFDTDSEVIKALEEGDNYLEHLPEADALFRHLADSPTFTATSDMGRLREADAVLICVPTPLGEHFEPDLSYVEACGRSIAKTLRPGQLIVLESTTYPGTTRERLLPCLSTEMDLGLSQLGDSLFLAFSPEREDPGNKTHHMASIPKLVGGLEPASTVAACALYQAAFEKVLPVTRAEVCGTHARTHTLAHKQIHMHTLEPSEMASPATAEEEEHALIHTHARTNKQTPRAALMVQVAEAAKLVENVYRAVNIALVNEVVSVLREIPRETERDREGQRDGATGRQRDRETERQRDRDRES
jgi:UDP-N-acetyl-D-mannosaminuronate dehydrogenase